MDIFQNRPLIKKITFIHTKDNCNSVLLSIEQFHTLYVLVLYGRNVIGESNALFRGEKNDLLFGILEKNWGND